MREFEVLKQKLPGVRRGVGIAGWDCESLRGGEGRARREGWFGGARALLDSADNDIV